MLAGAVSPQPHLHHANVQHAAALQVPYASNQQLATSASLEKLHGRFALLLATWGEKALLQGQYPTPMRADIAATLGATQAPDEDDTAAGIMVSRMLEEYEQIRSSELARKSPRQLAKWRVRRQSALDIFVIVIGGDKPFKQLTRKDAHALRKHWQKRIEDGEIRINSANRRIRHVSGLYTVAKDYHQVDGRSIFERIRIPGGEEGKRLPFDPAFVQMHYLAEGSLTVSIRRRAASSICAPKRVCGCPKRVPWIARPSTSTRPCRTSTFRQQIAQQRPSSRSGRFRWSAWPCAPCKPSPMESRAIATTPMWRPPSSIKHWTPAIFDQGGRNQTLYSCATPSSAA